MNSQSIKFKLVTQTMTSHNNTKWEVGKKVIATGVGNTMCSDQLLHCYSNPYLAVIFNPLHANIKNPRMIRVACSAILADDGLKQGCKKQKMLDEIAVPKLTTLQKVEFAIRVSMLNYTEKEFVKWANNWINGVDRSESAAWSAAWSAARAARSAAESARSAAESAARSAWSAARSAAESAAESAWSAARSAAESAWSAARAAAWSAARAAARSAESAARSAESAINKKFIDIITQIVDKG